MSELRANTISAANGTDPVTLTKQSAAKAWLNYNHPSNLVRESFNVSSVTDNTTGHLTKNYTNNMSSNDHVVSVSGYETGGTGPASDRFTGMARGPSRLLASASQYYAGDYTSPATARDQNVVVTVAFGDLA